ncbi:MAG TPA: hypothetical protein VN859_08035 [Steroidobacteraceae bacterium]|nr:hypothetical protein [Steroidobacteraceae bacterium]
MHKKPRPDKKSGARNADAGVTRSNKTLQINDLLSKRPSLARLTGAIPAQQAWVEWFRTELPADLAAHVVNVVPRGAATSGRATELVIFADSAAWGTRLRYALAALDARIRARDAQVGRWLVRIAPAGRQPWGT